MRLSDTQLVLLSNAARRNDRAVKLPSDIGAAAAEKLVSELAGAGFIEEIKANGALPVWRRLDDASFALRITDVGLKVIGVDDAVTATHPEHAVRKASVKTSKVADRPRRTTKTNARSKKPKSKVPKMPKKTHGVTQASVRQHRTKHDQILSLLRRTDGALLEDMQKVSGWQSHSVRGFLSGTVKKRLGLKLRSSVSQDGTRRYSVAG